MNPISDFVDAMRSAGIDTDYVPQGTGRIERFHINGDKSGKKNGWCVLFLDGHPIGQFGNWKTGVSESWHADKKTNMTRAEKIEMQHRIKVGQNKREYGYKQAQLKADIVWRNSSDVDFNHQYLVKKSIKPYGIKQSNDALIVPCFVNEELSSLQYIFPNGDKRFIKGGKIAGGHAILGSRISESVICICEGYATGASIFEATHYPTVIAFFADNIKPVAQAIRAKYPDAKIILCADNDRWTNGNPGITKAKEAALLIDGYLSVPIFANMLISDKKPTDFNDVHTMAGGLSVVKRIIELACKP